MKNNFLITVMTRILQIKKKLSSPSLLSAMKVALKVKGREKEKREKCRVHPDTPHTAVQLQ